MALNSDKYVLQQKKYVARKGVKREQMQECIFHLHFKYLSVIPKTES